MPTETISISAEDIRLAKPIALQRLTGISAASFVHWSNYREMNTRTVRRLAESLHTTPGEIMEGFRLRRIDSQAIKQAEAKFNYLLAMG